MTLRSLLPVATTALFGAMVISCSDPVPPSKQGAFAVHLTNTNGCNLTGSNISVGTVSATAHSPVQDSDATQVSCSVKQSGSGFAFSGNVQDTTNGIIFSISGNVSASAPDTMAAVSVAGEVTSHAVFSSTMCTVSVDTAISNNLGVAPGRIWAAVTCPVVSEPSSQKTCALTSFDNNNVGGYIVFENCEE